MNVKRTAVHIDPRLIDLLADLESLIPWLSGYVGEYLTIACSERGFCSDSSIQAAKRLVYVYKARAIQSMIE